MIPCGILGLGGFGGFGLAGTRGIMECKDYGQCRGERNLV